MARALFGEGYFFADLLFVFVYCYLVACNATNPGSQSGRGRREVGDHVTNVYSLAEDPLHLVREKREEKDLDKSGM